MGERETSTVQEKRVLVFDRKDEIMHRVQMIQSCRDMIGSVNLMVKRLPSFSEQASEVIQDNKALIANYANEITRIRNGETQIY